MRSIIEDFSYDNLFKHLKHVEQFENDPRCEKEARDLKNAIQRFALRYNNIADSLSREPAGIAYGDEDIVGYLRNDHVACKYDKTTGDFIAYDIRKNRNNIMTLHKKTMDQYLKIVARDFYKELPENQ